MFSSFDTSTTKSSSSPYDWQWNERTDALATTLFPSSESKHRQREWKNLTNRRFRCEERKSLHQIDCWKKSWEMMNNWRHERERKRERRRRNEFVAAPLLVKGRGRTSIDFIEEEEEEKNTQSYTRAYIYIYINSSRLTSELCECRKFLIRSTDKKPIHRQKWIRWVRYRREFLLPFSVYANGFTPTYQNEKSLRILIFAESFPSFTSGITRRFKEIIRRLATYKHDVHVITGCKVRRDETRRNLMERNDRV